MDANTMSKKAINEGINKGYYKITGVLKTGEVVIALLGDVEKDSLIPALQSEKSKEDKLKMTKALIDVKGRPAKEIMQIYKQYTCGKNKKCNKNGLRLR